MTSTEYLLPKMPSGGPEITIVRWLRSAGDRVSAGDPLLLVVNDRLELALPAPGEGVIERTLAAEGATVSAGAPVATIAPPPTTDTAEPPQPAQPDVAVKQTTVPERSVRISPVARQIATGAGIDVTQLTGSGISGRIVKADILAALGNSAPSIEIEHRSVSPSPDLPIPQSPNLQPFGGDIYVLTAVEADMQRVAEAVARLRPDYARRRLDLSFGACVALAAVSALAYHPLLNGAWDGDIILVRRRVHLAVAPSAGAPLQIIRNAQDLNLRGLARAFSGPPNQAGNGEQERTFTIVELGEQAWGDPSALVRGRSAALGVGAVRLRPLARDDGGVERLAMRYAALLTLAYDPRVLDQGHADAFLRDLKRRLEQFEP